MSNFRIWFREALGWSGALIAVAVGIPLIGIVLLALRAVLLPLGILALAGGGAVFCLSSRFRCWAHRMIRGDARSAI